MATRGTLLTFNFANDTIRHLTPSPALLVGVFPGVDALTILHLHAPTSATLPSVLSCTLMMDTLVPMSLVEVPYGATEMGSVLTTNTLVNGLSSVLTVAGSIKLIALVVSQLAGH